MTGWNLLQNFYRYTKNILYSLLVSNKTFIMFIASGWYILSLEKYSYGGDTNWSHTRFKSGHISGSVRLNARPSSRSVCSESHPWYVTSIVYNSLSATSFLLTDRLKDHIVAKLSSQCEDLYAECLKIFQRESLRTLWEKEWIPLVSVKCLKLILFLLLMFVCFRLQANKPDIMLLLNIIRV